MSFFPTTDIVSDVARAADPGRVRSAMRRLEKAATAHNAPPPGLESAPRLAWSESSHASLTSDAIRRTEVGPESPGKKFEAFLLQTWLEMLLPKEESGVFGIGASGSFWRSLMAEQLGAQLAGAGGIGVQKLIEQDYPSKPDSRT
ncbi:rod-binding protein [Methylocystis sp. JAN1]|uniref:rod-binding protein n=1 Tax=Methylocystis sp. JAN1 TaxID=3397211 RepID=UPI003FA20456